MTRYHRAYAFLAEATPRYSGMAEVEPWIIHRVAKLLPPEPPSPMGEQIDGSRSGGQPEWGEPIPTPGDSCPEWFTDELADGCQFLDTDRTWCTSRAPLALRTKGWVWQCIAALRFRKGHPIYAKVAENERGEAVAILEAAGYTVTPPAPPEPDYEAYRGRLAEFYKAKGLHAIAGHVSRGDALSGNAKANVKALIAVGVKP